MFGLNNTIHWYNRNAKAYAEALEDFINPDQMSRFVELLPPQGSILDVGCAAGRDMALFQKRGLKATGIDLSEGLITEARNRYPNLAFVLGDMREMPFKASEFDGLWVNASLLHLETIEDVQQALAEFYRVLKPRGILHILVKAKAESAAIEVGESCPIGEERFYRYFTKNELNELLMEAGFSLLHSEQYAEAERHAQGRKGMELVWVLAEKGVTLG